MLEARAALGHRAAMRVLAIDCATEACSAALFEGGELVGSRCEILGRGHAERLVPMISELPDMGKAQRIHVSLGPGSFTGTRIGIAAARALGIAWNSDVYGYPTLALVAAMARLDVGDSPVLVAMTGGHGEVFVQSFDAYGLPSGSHASLPLDAAAQISRSEVVAGSKASELVAHRGFGRALEILPDAASANLLPTTLLTENVSPIYGRPPDAKLPV